MAHPPTRPPRGSEDLATREAMGTVTGGGYRVFVCAPHSVSTFDIAPHASILVGRTEECDIRIDDHSVSRTHARIHGTVPAQIEDLGGRNGTRVAGVAIPPNAKVTFPLGTVVHLGDVSIVLEPASLNRFSAAPHGPEARTGPIILDGAMKRVYSLVDVIGPSSIPVLILGETGTGKEVLAATLHKSSPRADAPLLRLNCASFPESLLESELFGHEKGAFTGAIQAKQGLLESADGGTVFLDEVGEMPPATQAKMLRVLESGEVMRIGGLRPKTIDVRIISATNRDLQKQIAGGQFRSDLFFRLNGITLSLPPLRARCSEILPLARRFARDSKHASGAVTFTPGAETALERHDWPGNVRELKNAVERAVVLAAGGEVDTRHLMLGALSEAHASAAPVEAASTNDLRADLASIERTRILDALDRCGGNQSRAAKLLGISRGVLIKRINAYGITRPRKAVGEPKE